MAQSITPRQSIFILIVLGFTAYAPVLRVGFLWDDHELIEHNPYIQSWSWQNVAHDFSSTVSNGVGDAGYLRPMVTWSNRVDYFLWKLHPMGYHFTSIALHIGNSLLLYELILLLGCTPMTALLTCSLFVVHPIDVEGLLGVTGRATFLSFFFSLGAILLLVEPTPLTYVLGLCSFVFALFSKENSVVMPLFLALVWEVRRAPKRRYLILLPLGGLLGMYLLYRHYIFGAVGLPDNYLYALRFYLQAFPRVLTHYVQLVLFPWNLHSHRLIMRMSHEWYISLFGWAALAVWSFKEREKRPLVFFCVYWFIIGLLPSSPLMVHGGFMPDHYGYWIALAVLLPLGIFFNYAWTQPDRNPAHRAGFLYFPLLIFYALLVHLNVELRGTDEKMWRWALHFTTSNPIKYNLGALLVRTGRPGEGLPYLEDVLRVYPDDPMAEHAYARAYWDLGHHAMAIRLLEKEVRQHPDFMPAVQSLAAMKAIERQAGDRRHQRHLLN